MYGLFIAGQVKVVRALYKYTAQFVGFYFYVVFECVVIDALFVFPFAAR